MVEEEAEAEAGTDFKSNSSASGKCMDENRACTNFRPSFPAEGAPVYEQKGVAAATKECRKARFLRMTRAERTADFHYKLYNRADLAAGRFVRKNYKSAGFSG